MSLVNIHPWLLRAQNQGYAIGAFNANTLEQAQAVVWAAERERAPAILQISQRAAEYAGAGNASLGLRYMAAIGSIAAESVTVPIGLHLDHATEEQVVQAIQLGFTSAMFDGGDLAFEENVRITRKLAGMAHQQGISLEAELGQVARGLTAERSAHALTDPAQAAEFVAATQVDALGIAIGSVHGVESKSVLLDLARLQAIRAQVKVPLVLHGSSGVTDDCLLCGIAIGLCKVNVATQLNQAFTGGVREVLVCQDSATVDPRRYLQAGRAAMIDRVRERIHLFGSSGKAL